jgi:hypothetical protein
MPNILTNLMPDIYDALDVVSREMVGFIPAVTLDAGVERAALNQTVRSFVTPAATAEDSTPGQLPPDSGDQTINNVPITITRSRAAPFRWTGEEEKGANSGPGARRIRVDQITQAMRTLTNEMEVFIGGIARAGASRAWGTPGAAPFAGTLNDPAQVLKILKDNGAPVSDLQLVIDTTAGANIRSQVKITDMFDPEAIKLRGYGTLLDVHSFKIRESAGVSEGAAWTIGTGKSYVTNGALAVGATVIPVQSGTGTISAGDILTFASDSVNKYVVTGALTGGNVTIGAPGLRVAVPTGTAVTVLTAATANVAFHRSAIVLATRPPALPEGGDMADDRTLVTDPVSGVTFEFATYPQYLRRRYEVRLAYGGAVIKQAHTALLLG